MDETVSTAGPYHLLEPLGHGGMGIVYRAEHTQTGAQVALKMIKVANAGMLRGFRREIHTLARIRHEGIVEILDQGILDGLPWYAMELVEGVSLANYVPARRTEAPTIDLADTVILSGPMAAGEKGGNALEQASPRAAGSGEVRPRTSLAELMPILTLLRRLCQPLAYLHGEGIVHGDLKPENIIIRNGHTPVLLDFGVTSQFAGNLSWEGTRIEAGMAGTVPYMAPEQAQGEMVDARADLYSLGCILFELVVGRPPFADSSAFQVIWSHVNAPPPVMSDLVEGVPQELDDLALRLLEKRPQNRIGYADDVAAALVRLGAGQDPPSREPEPKPYLYQARLAGRSDQLTTLAERLDACEASQGQTVLVCGESGVGKTRLVLEFSRAASKREAIVLTGECRRGSARPLQGLARPLRMLSDRCREKGRIEADRLLGARGKLLALYEPSIAELSGQDAFPMPAAIPPAAARKRLFSYLAGTLSALSEQGTVLLIVEDLQWADELTVGFLEALAASSVLQDSALLVIGTYRADVEPERLRALKKAPGIDVLELSSLAPAAVAEMVGDMLAHIPAPQVFSRFVAQQSGGNPFYVAEYLQTAVLEGLLRRDHDGFWQLEPEDDPEAAERAYSQLPLPRTLRHLVARRIQALEGSVKALLETLCVLGRETTSSLAAVASGLPTEELYDGISELLRLQILDEMGESLRFTHDHLRDVAYQALPPDRRANLHRSVAAAMEELPATERELRMAELAHHWVEAVEESRARSYYLAAARRAKDRYAHAEAEEHYLAYFRLQPDITHQSIAARNELGRDVLGIQGRHDDAIAQYEQAWEESQFIGDRDAEAEALECLGRVHYTRGAMELARSFYEEALRIVSDTNDKNREAGILVDLAMLSVDQGRIDDGCFLSEQALVTALEAKNRQAERRALLHLANVHRVLGNLEGARPVYDRALSLAVKSGDRRGEAEVLTNLSKLEAAGNHYGKSQTLSEKALRIFQEIVDLEGEARVLTSLAGLHTGKGWLSAAAETYEKAMKIEEELGHRVGKGVVLTHLANLKRIQGDLDDAIRFCWEAVSIFQELNDEVQLVRALCCEGHIALARRRPAGAQLREARRVSEKLGVVGKKGSVIRALEKLERAHEAFEHGAEHLLFRGQLVGDIPVPLRQKLVETGELSWGES